MSTLGYVGISILLLVLLLMLSIPLPFCFGGALAFLVMTCGVSMKSLMLYSLAQCTGTVLLASPLFILAGTYMGGSGIASRLRVVMTTSPSMPSGNGRPVSGSTISTSRSNSRICIPECARQSTAIPYPVSVIP